VPVFGEKFVLPVLATLATAVVFLNPMKWDWQSRIALLVGLAAFAFLLSHELHLRNEAIRTGKGRPTIPTAPPGEPVSAQPKPRTMITGPASSSGDNSPANTGSKNTFIYGPDAQKTKKTEPSKKR